MVDASSFLAGPFIGALLADWGADVVKVEPPDGDSYRGSAVAALVASQHKRVLAADLARPEGREIFLALLAGADVLVENFRPGRLDRFGLAESALQATSPGLVHCKVAAYASMGRMRTRRGSTRCCSRAAAWPLPRAVLSPR
jgi:crotonobetainyl-CoA:carnitine CoA-transferase CaiB-like acyl-CoA transferase